MSRSAPEKPLSLTPDSDGDIALNTSWAYNDGFYFDPQNAVKQPSYSLINASIGYQPASAAWGVRLWGKNLAKAHHYTAILPQTYGDTATPAAPRAYGISLNVQFGAR